MAALDFQGFIQWVFLGVVSGTAICMVKILWDMKTSIENLNLRMAQILETTKYHEKRLDRFEERLMSLKQT